KMLHVNKRACTPLLLAAILAWQGSSTGTASGPKNGQKEREEGMSAMGRKAARAVAAIDRAAAGISTKALDASDECVNEPDCGDEEPPDGPAETQAETTIAVDSTGQHIVVGYNDFRGFGSNPVSISGFMYSDDGGRTFVDGGQLPSPGNE